MSEKLYIAKNAVEYIKDGKRTSAQPGEPVVFDDEDMGDELVEAGAIREATEGEVALFEKQMAAQEAAASKKKPAATRKAPAKKTAAKKADSGDDEGGDGEGDDLA